MIHMPSFETIQSFSRPLSLLVAGTYILMVGYGGGAESAFYTGLYTVMPLACIWFSQAMGDYAGGMRVRYPSPAPFVFVLGWIVLLLPVIIPVVASAFAWESQ